MGTRSALCFLLALVAIGSAAADGQISSPTNTNSGISLDIAAVQDIVKAGSAVTVRATLTNGSEKDLADIWWENGEGITYKVDVRRAQDGKSASETRHGSIRNGHIDRTTLTPAEVSHSGRWFTLKPAEFQTDEVNVSSLYDLSVPGKYLVQLIFAPGKMPELKSNVISVTVAP